MKLHYSKTKFGAFNAKGSLYCSLLLVRNKCSLLIPGGGKRRGLGPRNDVLTTCKAVTLRGGQRIIALFPTVNIFLDFLGAGSEQAGEIRNA